MNSVLASHTEERGESMSVNVLGHDYNVQNVESDYQRLRFIQKQPAQKDSSELVTVQDGTTTEAVLRVLIDRLKFLHAKLPDELTRIAAEHLKSALHLLEQRTEERKLRGIEGTNQA